MTVRIQILPASTITECRLSEQLSEQIWQGSLIDVVPDHMLTTIALNGGVVLLAYDGAIPIGFCFGFLGLTPDGRLKHCSHRNGVLPAYRGNGVGFALKLAQREHVLAQGIDLITWTFDPLLTQNGRLNLHKLGAICNTYQRNVYGETRDMLNQGLPTDRFLVEWWVSSKWVQNRAGCIQTQANVPPMSQYKTMSKVQANGDDHEIRPSATTEIPDSEAFLFEVPSNFNALKTHTPELAQEWRYYTRSFFENAFAANYIAIDLVRQGPRCYYLLIKHETLANIFPSFYDISSPHRLGG